MCGAFVEGLFQPPSPQVSTWFANARRRLKKENKVTWSPRACKSSDDRGYEDDSDEAERPLKRDEDLPGEQEKVSVWTSVALPSLQPVETVV